MVMNYLQKKRIYETDLPHRAVVVYFYLVDRANSEGVCYPSMKTIAGDLHLSVSTVKKAIGDLVDKGFLRTEQRWRENGGRGSLCYEINQ